MTQPLRKCRECGLEAHTEKDLDLFVKRSTHPYGRETLCKKCQNKRISSYFADNRDKQRESNLKTNYGLTNEEYKTMFEEQQGCCKICGKHQSEFKKPLFVDHCHTGGEVRGLLCTKCNSMLGMADDNIAILKNAIEYLDN
jgi:hypothetical protein